jgi:DNA-binding NarL/FixJ family response regulator
MRDHRHQDARDERARSAESPFRELLETLEEAAQIGEHRQRQAIDPDRLKDLERLTSREREVLAAISEGMQSKVIAWELGISVRTVEMHRARILTKLSARNTTQAVAIAKSAGFDRGSFGNSVQARPPF